LIDGSVQAAEFMITTNEIQTGIAEEIKSSGDATRKFSKNNIILTYIVIFLGILGITVYVYTIWQSNRDANIRRIETRENIKLLLDKLNIINNSIVANGTSKIENDRLKGQVEKQKKILVI